MESFIVLGENLKVEIKEYLDGYEREIAQLFTNSIHNTCHKDYTKEQLDAWANPNIEYAFWAKKVKKTKPFLAFIEEELVGFSEFYDDYIDCFYVSHLYQSKGVGKALLSHIIDLSRDKKIKKLNVDASITAKPFFLKYGFKEVKENLVKRKDQELINYSLELNI